MTDDLKTPEILAELVLKAVDVKTFTVADEIQDLIDDRPMEEVLEVGCLSILDIPLETRDLLQKNMLLSSIEGMEPIGVALIALRCFSAPVCMLEVISKLHQFDAMACLFMISTWEDGEQVLADFHNILKGRKHDGKEKGDENDKDPGGEKASGVHSDWSGSESNAPTQQGYISGPDGSLLRWEYEFGRQYRQARFNEQSEGRTRRPSPEADDQSNHGLE